MASIFDGVLADFNEAFVARIIEETKRNLFPPWPFDIPCWGYPQEYGYTAEEENAVWRSINVDATFWQTLEPYANVRQQLRRLEGMNRFLDDVYFITSRPGQGTKWQTERWLRIHGVAEPTVLISGKKGDCARALQLDFYIDDKDSNCVDVKQARPECEVFLLNQPWNQGLNTVRAGVRRIGSLWEFMDVIGAPQLRVSYQGVPPLD